MDELRAVTLQNQINVDLLASEHFPTVRVRLLSSPKEGGSLAGKLPFLWRTKKGKLISCEIAAVERIARIATDGRTDPDGMLEFDRRQSLRSDGNASSF